MLLAVKELESGYRENVVLRKVSLQVCEGEIVALIGHNGAGKTTTLRTIVGLLKPLGGEIEYNDESITGHAPVANVLAGISFVPQERAIFSRLTVKENLDMASHMIWGMPELEASLRNVYVLFPILERRLQQRAGTLSGGEQRMLSVGMALIQKPRLLLLDEPSLGLAPVIVQELMKTIKNINQVFGTSILLVEQNIKAALNVSQRVYVLKTGQVIFEGESQGLVEDEQQLWRLF